MESRKSTSKEILCRDERSGSIWTTGEKCVRKADSSRWPSVIENEQHEEEILPCGDVSLRI